MFLPDGLSDRHCYFSQGSAYASELLDASLLLLHPATAMFMGGGFPLLPPAASGGDEYPVDRVLQGTKIGPC